MPNAAAVVTKLVSLRAKVDETIAHVQSGVGNLNEDQVEQAEAMLEGLIKEAKQTYRDSMPLLHDAETFIQKAEAFIEQVVADVKTDLGIGEQPATVTIAKPPTAGVFTPTVQAQLDAEDAAFRQEHPDVPVVLVPSLESEEHPAA